MYYSPGAGDNGSDCACVKEKWKIYAHISQLCCDSPNALRRALKIPHLAECNTDSLQDMMETTLNLLIAIRNYKLMITINHKINCNGISV